MSPGPEKLKIWKCSVSIQISGEGWLWLVKVLHGLISSINLLYTDLFMIQVKKMFFLESWVRTIQAPPNSVWWPPNSWSLTLFPPNMYGKPIKVFLNKINHFFSLFMNLLLKQFHKKTFSNLVFGDEFDSNMTIGMYHDLFHVL